MGRFLHLFSKDSCNSSALTCTKYHTVQRGENIRKIAKRYQVSRRWLAEINRLDDPSHLFAGNRLCVQTSTSSGPAPQKPDGKVIPTFTISRVDPGSTVTVQTSNFPANYTFNVYMGQMGTRGVNGILAGTIESGKGGSFTVSLVIPAALRGNNQIAIRLESPTSGYFAYNWFYNR